ncbi:CgeB family protein [Ulvibacterium marinum]|uniref:CgeB family protein n=1 Tax=Ulvibacterium marinum TaxID=2419782 RepID=UPI002495088C|nr:glycosyltransferase [Ulvibacterium marinum]
MKVLSVGWFRSESSTSLHRHLALKKNVDYIDKVEAGPLTISLKYRMAYHLFQKGIPIPLPDKTQANSQIKKLVAKNKYDIIWIDKGITIDKSTLLYIKRKLPNARIISFSPDNMALRHNQSQNYLDCIPYYDYTFTTKSYIINDLNKLGAKNVNFIHKTYGEDFHYPRDLSKVDLERLGGDVGFVGAWEKERCDSILFLAKNGINVKVFGDGKWNQFKSKYPNLSILPGIFSEDYPKALQAFKISLCFLRKINFDQQTARTMEIPACGGFMLAERTPEHLNLFEEGKEASYFSSNEELLDKCIYYLSRNEERKKIALAGLERCRKSGYSNEKTMRKMLDLILVNE